MAKGKTICLIITAVIAVLFVGMFIAFYFLHKGNTLKADDVFINDPHEKDPPYVVKKVKEHPNYSMIKKNGLLNLSIGDKNYCHVDGGSEFSDMSTLFYLTFPELKEKGSVQYEGLLNSVKSANFNNLSGRANYNIADFNAVRAILDDPNITSFASLSNDQKGFFYRCSSCITSNYFVENAEKLVINMYSGAKATPDDLRRLANEVLLANGSLPSFGFPQVRLMALQNVLNLDIICAAMVNEKAKLVSFVDNKGRFSSGKKLKVRMFWYGGYKKPAFSPITSASS